MLTNRTTAIQSWKPIRRAALIGAVIPAEAVMLIVAGYSSILAPVLAYSIVIAAIAAAIAGLIAYLLSGRKDNSLDDLERELAKAAAIFERGLINEAEYNRIKGQVVEQYQYSCGGRWTNHLWRVALRGASVGLLVPILALFGSYQSVSYFVFTLLAAGTGATVLGGGAAAVQIIRQKFSQPQLPPANQPLIDAQPQRKIVR